MVRNVKLRAKALKTRRSKQGKVSRLYLDAELRRRNRKNQQVFEKKNIFTKFFLSYNEYT